MLLPLYYRIFRTLEQRIRDQHYRVGDRFPSEDELGREFRASRITIRQALGRLVEQGLIVRRRGSGSFVSATAVRGPTTPKFTGTLEDLFAQVRAVGTKSAEIIEEAPPADVRALLGLGGQETVAVVRRVRTFRERIFSLSTNYLPKNIGVLLSESDLYEYPLLQLLEEKLHLVFRYADQTIEARLADEDVAKSLDISFGDPVLFVERLMFAEANRPVEVVRSYYRGDVYRYQMRLVRSRKAPFHWRLNEDGS
jgi:GntR family transcriptional regulator